MLPAPEADTKSIVYGAVDQTPADLRVFVPFS